MKLKRLKKMIRGVLTRRVLVMLGVLMLISVAVHAQDVGAGAAAIDEVTGQLKTYVKPVKNLLYAIAAVVGLGGAISVFAKMNNDDQDVKKTIMMVVGSCIALIALAEAIPMFFGV